MILLTRQPAFVRILFIASKSLITSWLLVLASWLNVHPVFYEGSEDATIGNGLRYRVKDVAAYYLGKITGIPATFYDKWPERDAEIERLKEKWKAQE